MSHHSGFHLGEGGGIESSLLSLLTSPHYNFTLPGYNSVFTAQQLLRNYALAAGAATHATEMRPDVCRSLLLLAGECFS